jgi:hypothetical protein
VDGDDGPGPGRERGLDQCRIQVERGGIDIDPHDARARVLDREARRDVAVDGGDDLVAGTDAPRAQQQVQRLGPARHGHAMARPAVGGELFLEGADVRTHHVLAGLEHTRDSGVHLLPVEPVVGRRVEEPDAH